MDSIHQSSKSVSSLTKQQNKKEIERHIACKSQQRCGVLRRFVSLEKFIEANERRKDAGLRFKVFFVALDIIKGARCYSEKILDGYRCFEIVGCACRGETVTVHLREERDERGNKTLYLISCFHKP